MNKKKIPMPTSTKEMGDLLVAARIEERKALAKLTHPPFGVGGWFQGNILIIAEQSAKPPLHKIGQDPFCGMKGSSKWLNLLLEINHVEEEGLFWINALNLDGTKADVVKIAKLLKPSKVIALGNVASNLCNQNNIEHIKIPHPAYWKRFHSKEMYPLIQHVI